VHDAAKRVGASPNDVDATGHDGCVTDNKIAGTIESARETEKAIGEWTETICERTMLSAHRIRNKSGPSWEVTR
jgi:hypothetical protein